MRQFCTDHIFVLHLISTYLKNLWEWGYYDNYKTNNIRNIVKSNYQRLSDNKIISHSDISVICFVLIEIYRKRSMYFRNQWRSNIFMAVIFIWYDFNHIWRLTSTHTSHRKTKSRVSKNTFVYVECYIYLPTTILTAFRYWFLSINYSM